jgi:hypothetical protein
MSDIPPPPPESSTPPPQQEVAAMPPPPPAPSFAPSAAVAVADSGPVGKPRSAGLIILLTIVTLGIWTWVWSYQNGDELKRYAKTGIGGVGYLLITIFIAPVTMFLMASEVEQLYRREGKEPPITTLWGLWFLLPIIGLFIWYIRIQKSLNEYWVAHGAPA